MGARWINRKDGDFALAWVKSYGKGRVFNTTFGHMSSITRTCKCSSSIWMQSSLRPATWTRPITPRGAPAHRDVPGTQPVAGMEPGFVPAVRRQDAGRLGRRPHDRRSRMGRLPAGRSPASSRRTIS